MEGYHATLFEIFCTVGGQLAINHYVEKTWEFPAGFGGNRDNSFFGFFAALGVIVSQDNLFVTDVARDFKLEHCVLLAKYYLAADIVALLHHPHYTISAAVCQVFVTPGQNPSPSPELLKKHTRTHCEQKKIPQNQF